MSRNTGKHPAFGFLHMQLRAELILPLTPGVISIPVKSQLQWDCFRMQTWPHVLHQLCLSKCLLWDADVEMVLGVIYCQAAQVWAQSREDFWMVMLHAPNSRAISNRVAERFWQWYIAQLTGQAASRQGPGSRNPSSYLVQDLLSVADLVGGNRLYSLFPLLSLGQTWQEGVGALSLSVEDSTLVLCTRLTQIQANKANGFPWQSWWSVAFLLQLKM